MAEGQFLGNRKSYIYVSDEGTKYIALLDETLASLADVGFDEYTGQADAQPMPKRFKMRLVYWEATDFYKRKRLYCGKNDATLYKKKASTNLIVDGVAGFTTGRVGEKMSYVKIATNDEPPAGGG